MCAQYNPSLEDQHFMQKRVRKLSNCDVWSIVSSKNCDIIAQKYHHFSKPKKCSSSNIINMKPEGNKKSSLVIFDWDDTLFFTSATSIGGKVDLY